MVVRFNMRMDKSLRVSGKNSPTDLEQPLPNHCEFCIFDNDLPSWMIGLQNYSSDDSSDNIRAQSWVTTHFLADIYI